MTTWQDELKKAMIGGEELAAALGCDAAAIETFFFEIDSRNTPDQRI